MSLEKRLSASDHKSPNSDPSSDSFLKCVPMPMTTAGLTLSPPSLVFGTWPGAGAAVNAVMTVQQIGVTQSASTSPTNIVISSPLIPRHSPQITTQSLTKYPSVDNNNPITNISTNSSTVAVNDSPEEHSYANTRLNCKCGVSSIMDLIVSNSPQP